MNTHTIDMGKDRQMERWKEGKKKRRKKGKEEGRKERRKKGVTGHMKCVLTYKKVHTGAL